MFKCCKWFSKCVQASHFYGISLAFIAGLCLAMGGLFSNFLMGTRSQAVFVQFVLTFMGSLPVVTWRRRDVFIPQRRVMLQILMFAVCSCVGTLTFYLSFTYLPMGDVFAIYNTFIVSTQLLSCAFLKETCQISDVVFTFVSLIGVICVAQPDFIFSRSLGSAHNLPGRLTGVLMIITSSFATAGTIVMSRVIGYRANSTLVMLCRGLLGFLCVAVFMFFIGDGYSAPCLEDCAYLALSGSFGCISLLFRHMALQVERAGPVAVAYTSQIGFAFIFDFFVFNFAANLICVLGVTAIFISAFGTLLRAHFSKISIRRNQKNTSI